MIISNSRKFIFVHLHKCAGTNVTRSLSEILSWNDIECGCTRLGESVDKYYMEKYGIGKHSRACEIRAVVGEEIWDQYFTFSFVRNPYSRAVSLFTFIGRLVESRTRGIRKYTRLFKRGGDQQFWSWPLTQAYMASRSFSDFIRNDHFIQAAGSRPQLDFLSAQDSNEIIVDFVGKVERFDEDFSLILERIGLEGIEAGDRRTSSWKPRFHDYYRGQEDYDLISELYRVDFEAFNYDYVRGEEAHEPRFARA